MNRLKCLLLCSVIFAGLVSPVVAQEASQADIWLASYDTVWQTVNDFHYDSTFGGLDWNEIHDRYHGLVSHVDNDDDFMKTVNQMLGELKLSHYAVFHAREKAKSGSSILSGGSIGIDLRVLDGQAVITSVKPGFPGAEAGLRVGYAIESIDGTPVAQIIAEAGSEPQPWSNERRQLSDLSDDIVKRCFGEAGTSVTLTYADESSVAHEVTLVRQQRTGETVIDQTLPPFFVDFEARRIDGNIGYVSFSVFAPPVDERFNQALDSMLDVTGLIIDIRGNPGGMHEIGEAIASRLVQKETLFSVFRYRDEVEEVAVKPVGTVYNGPVVVLIDVMNASASERFSACIQSIGRAIVIGERSSGSVGPSNVKLLPNGASFMYLIAQSLTPDGTVLEGHGVIPDVVVGLDRQGLLEGKDAQLEWAIAYIDGAAR